MIQIDIDMPEDCDACPCCEMFDLQENWGKCKIANREFICFGTVDDNGNTHRPEWCPMKEVKQGKWISYLDSKFVGGAHWSKCSECKWVVPSGLQSGYHYCPSCGARMEE